MAKKSGSKKNGAEKVYVCVICGKETRAKAKKKKLICCGEEMTSREKGSWNL